MSRRKLPPLLTKSIKVQIISSRVRSSVSLAVFASAWLDPGSYARKAFVSRAPLDWLQDWAKLVAFNFEPWRWVWGRPAWLPVAG